MDSRSSQGSLTRLVRPLSAPVVLGALWTLSLLTVVWFTKTDWTVGPSTGGTIHRYASVVGFVSLPVAVQLVAGTAFPASPGWRITARALGAVPLACLAVLLAGVVRMAAGRGGGSCRSAWSSGPWRSARSARSRSSCSACWSRQNPATRRPCPPSLGGVLSTSNVLTFAALSLVMIVIPGPSVLFTIGRALTLGRREALLSVAGNATGAYLQVIAVAFGVGVVVQRSATVFTVVKLVGAGYLVYLGLRAIRHRRRVSEALGLEMPRIGTARALRDGVVVGFANPKTIVFLVVVLPQFTDSSVRMLLLGTLFPLIALASDSVWAFAAATARAWFARSPRRLELVGGTGGLMMIGLGASIAVTGRRD